MEFQCGVVSDVGTTRKVNQDSACIHIQDSIIGNVGFAVVCDGMGGLSHGEFASQSMIEKIEKWYDSEFKELLVQGVEVNQLREQLDKLLVEHNKYLIEYGNDMGASMGTTVSLLLMLPGRYFGIHVGDSRIYKIGKRTMEQITNDHSRVMQEVRMGIITPTEAERDTRKNQLLQCIGARGSIQTEFFSGNIDLAETFLLCSDGFVHKLQEKEMWRKLRPNKAKKDEIIQKNLLELVEENKKMNLTSITEYEDVVWKHFLDSALIMKDSLWNGKNKVFDVGTGAGFPGIVLAILNPESEFVLLDSLNKRVDFLKQVCDKLKINNVTAIHGRAETYGQNERYRNQFDFVVSRAVAELPILMEYCVPFVKVNGYFVSYKGKKQEEEVKLAENAFHELSAKFDHLDKFSLREKEERYLLFIRKVEETNSKYPRKEGKPKKKPL